MKKIIIIIALLILLTPSIIKAQGAPVVPAGTEKATDLINFTKEAGGAAGFDTAPDRTTQLATFGGKIVSTFLSILGIVFMVYTLYGGYLWMTAGGNEEHVTKAKAIIKNGIIGIIIIFSVYGIYLIVAAIFYSDVESFSTGGF